MKFAPIKKVSKMEQLQQLQTSLKLIAPVLAPAIIPRGGYGIEIDEWFDDDRKIELNNISSSIMSKKCDICKGDNKLKVIYRYIIIYIHSYSMFCQYSNFYTQYYLNIPLISHTNYDLNSYVYCSSLKC